MCEPNDGYADICILYEFLISNFSDPIKAIVGDTYADLIHNYLDSNYLQSRAILASTIEVVDDINQYITNLLPGEDKEYFSSDSIDKCDATNFDAYEYVSPEFLNALKTFGLPNHSIRLKVGVTIMLMRNLDQSEGFGNGTRLTVTRLASHVIEAKINFGKKILTVLFPEDVSADDLNVTARQVNEAIGDGATVFMLFTLMDLKDKVVDKVCTLYTSKNF
ncbi:uncharacterized protein LOC131616859 [Vicia villosa]|uniref:uncharacterized protein LOC131616859 n=1 Tax=Vicia villosa TaxID=3911 RepID=UPI00273CA3A3|nr:uncharacterized protein LOC131616859 [Vicia villosa]